MTVVVTGASQGIGAPNLLEETWLARILSRLPESRLARWLDCYRST